MLVYIPYYTHELTLTMRGINTRSREIFYAWRAWKMLGWVCLEHLVKRVINDFVTKSSEVS